ncbi:DUF4845 domain-containing protein [Thermomonas sp. XSG]|jgi:hypothetical protein|uniref:DUF4845 domain-containing protein n=1 Tax=Thermomonas sp. XSG TaxID=2771436 RepID=UPI00086CF91E|nr:DUF4845 domain-containing protein [Thermomonas sp. XSG]ODU53161.1 MAG: hypothetical protein ABS98_01600 [Xanthomonadaceae bacterium SCN 69-48]QNU15771.1 DUF4845 domain-containing protein [Thermomonas sp. XSG]
MKQKQRGITMLGFLMVLCLVIFFAFCAMKIVPMYIEFYSVKQALKGLAEDQSLAGASKEKIREMYLRRLEMSYADNVKKMDAMKFESGDGGVKMVVDYERRESLLANLDVVGKFHAEQVLTRGTSGE